MECFWENDKQESIQHYSYVIVFTKKSAKMNGIQKLNEPVDFSDIR